MTFEEKIGALIERLPSIIDHLETEEATKNSLVMPFISALGYDVFNPKEVMPEFTADVGTKKGEKVDYAIFNDGEVSLIFECKKAGVDLKQTDMSQLFRYFSVTKARIAVLTNGIEYKFYSDLEESNKMDDRPFLEFSLDDPKGNIIQEVKKFAKDKFDLAKILSTASELKYTSAIKKILTVMYESPDEDFVRFFFGKVCSGSKFMGKAKENFEPLVKKAFSQFISERISDRLRTALETEGIGEVNPQVEVTTPNETEEEQNSIVTTEEELEAYRIVCAILTRTIDVERIAHRDAKSYMSIFLDDNNRKPICRFRFNTKQKYLGTFNQDKTEIKQPIEKVSDIYKYSQEIIDAIQIYESES